MRFILPLTLLSSLAIASPIEKSSEAGVEPIIIKGVLDNLNGGIVKTDKDIKAWRGDASTVNTLFQDASYLLNDIRNGAAQVAASPQVSIWDRPDWLKPAYDLDNNLEKLVNTLIGKKKQFDSIGRSNDIGGVLGNIKSSVDELVKVIFSKLPGVAQPLARPISNQIVGKVDKAMKAYSGTPRSIFGGSSSTSSSNQGSWWNGGNSAPKPSGSVWGSSAPPSSAPPSSQPAWSNSQPPASSWGGQQQQSSGWAGQQQGPPQSSGWGGRPAVKN